MAFVFVEVILNLLFDHLDLLFSESNRSRSQTPTRYCSVNVTRDKIKFSTLPQTTRIAFHKSI